MDKLQRQTEFRLADPGRLLNRDYKQTIARAAIAHGMTRINKSKSAVMHAREHWPFDEDVQLLLRAAAPPHDMTNAAALVQIGLAILPLLAPASAAAQLFQICPQITLGNASGGVVVPSSSEVNVAFVGDGKPKPVVQGSTSGVRVDPHKIAGIIPVSSELFELPNVETFMQSLLSQSAGGVLDSVALSNVAGTADHPPGLLYGITPITATAAGAGANTNDTMLGDIKNLAGALAPISGAGKIAIIMHPTQNVPFYFRTTRASESLVFFVSGAIPPGTIIAVAVDAVAAAIDAPEFDSSTHATLSMNDTAAPWPGGPVSSMFQTASIAIKMILKVSWALRSPSGAAWISNVNW